ncbi:MAG TPA: ribonucleotide reductase subunit alpha [Pseudomonadales bacterium]|nr:ribonucleotide reductase subunit alpha [Pseudomonadales bacterium]
MLIQTFDDLLTSARQQPDAQRLLFVFAVSELPEDATPEQRARFRDGLGGALTPLMEVDRLPDELEDFAQLVSESLEFAEGTPAENWAIVFCAALGGSGSNPPSREDADQPLRTMTDSIRMGRISSYIAFDRMGHQVHLVQAH